jgi:hypothetical protein
LKKTPPQIVFDLVIRSLGFEFVSDSQTFAQTSPVPMQGQQITPTHPITHKADDDTPPFFFNFFALTLKFSASAERS